MAKNKHITVDADFVKKLKIEALEQGMTLIELSRRLAKIDEPFKKIVRKENEKKNYWIKL